MELRLENGGCVGHVAVRRQGEETVFTVTARLAAGLWRIVACGSAGELTLGVLEGGEQTLHRRFSRSLTDRLGQVESVTARRSAITRMESEWRVACSGGAPYLPSLPPGTVCRSRGSGYTIAIPWRQGEPFPLTGMFCLARVGAMAGQTWVFYTINSEGEPIFQEK